MKHATPLGLLIVCGPVLAGCGGAPVDEIGTEPVGAAASSLITENAIVPNAIVPNAIVPNAIVPNAIVPNALDPGALDSASLAALVDPGQRGSLSRLFLKYTVGCALDPTQSFSFSWTDDLSVVQYETYWGVLGIAPSWATQALTDGTKQRLISGCLAGRTNYFGTPVTISMRSPQNPGKKVPAEELAAYPNIEGAFWGNLFTSSPYLHACYNDATVATSRAALRDCATGYVGAGGQILPCGPIVLAGACDSVCPNLGDKFYTSCSDPPGSSSTTTAVITTALP